MLYIIKTDYYMCSYILQPLKNMEDVKLITYKKRRIPLASKVKRYLRAFWIRQKGLWINDFYYSEFLSEIAQIGKEDKVLFFSLENLKDLRILDQEIQAKCKNVYLWNPVSSGCRNWYSKAEYRIYMHRINMRVYTFDPHDAQLFGFTCINQVYRLPDIKEVPSNSTNTMSIFYVGKEKRRNQTLANLASLFVKAGLQLNWYILKDRRTKELDVLKEYYCDTPLSYDNVIVQIQNTDCMLEVLQKGQSGVTLRTIEAMFFRKKLITNNTSVVDCDFYNPNNIFIYSHRTKVSEVVSFLSNTYEDVKPEITNQYDICNWITHFV